MKTLKTLLFAALATIGFSFAAQAVDEPLGTQTPREGGWWRMVKTDTGTDLVLCYTDTATAGFTWTVPGNVTAIEYLVVGGGGAGGLYGRTGGGGAGGLVTNTVSVLVGSELSITVGAGGASASTSGTAKNGNNGKDSSLYNGENLIALGVGGGGGGSSAAGSAGGSGGGGSGRGSGTTARAGGASTQNDDGREGLGKIGGASSSTSSGEKGGGGGGGAGGPGTGTTTKAGGAGGDGVMSTITGEEKWYAGGGGGGGSSGGGAGGSGVGGKGATGNKGNSGVDGTGSGGGGTGNTSGTGNATSGKGGDGAVIIRYTMPTEDYLPINIAEYEHLDCVITALGILVSDGDTMYKEVPLTVVATPQVGYEYTEVPEGWARVGDTRSITREFTAGESSFEIDIPVATAANYEFALAQSNRGIVNASEENGTYGSGQQITLAASENEGYFFAGWLVNGEKTKWMQSEITIMMDEDKAVEPVFYRIDPTFGYDYAVEGGDEVVMCTNVTKSGTFTIPDGVTKLEYLIVGGGGSGGSQTRGGGGGAGGFVTDTLEGVTRDCVFSIVVGAGGAQNTSSGAGNNGGDSSLSCAAINFEVKGFGGGGGGCSASKPAKAGGSGGGADGQDTGARDGALSTQPGSVYGGLGNPGGSKVNTTQYRAGSGGGGAGGKGVSLETSSTTGRAGGPGVVSSITGEEKPYAGGGGGGGEGGGGAGGAAGGITVGGAGGKNAAGNPGKDGTGSGGGGAGNTGSGKNGGKGGNGVVILRYTPAFPVTFGDPENATVSAKVDGFTIASGDLVLNGEDVVVEVTPDENYEYAEAPEGWEKVEDSTAITRTFKVDYKDLEIEAPAPTEKPTFTVTTLACENGSIEGAGTYHRDEVVTLTAIPADGYAFKAWTGVAEGQEGAVIQLTITANVEVGATFEKMAADKRLVYYTGGENASYTVKSGDEDVPSGSQVDVGATVVVVVTPNEHYAFVKPIPEGWVAGQEPGSLTKSFTADEDVTFEIPSAELITFELEVTQPEHGLIRGAESGILPEGELVELSVEAYEGYEFVNWTTNDAPAGTETTLSFTMQEDMSVGAEITRIYRAVTFEAPENTEMTVQVDDEDIESGDPVEYGSAIVVTILPVGEFEYPTIPTDWKKGDVEGSITRTYTAGDQPLELNDLPPTTAIPRYKLTVEACENGSIEVEGGLADDYLRDTEVTLTAKPNTGYILSYWTGGASSAVNPLTVKMTKDMTIGAVFRQTADFDAYERGNLIAMWDSKDGGHINSTGWTDTSGRYTFKWSNATKVNYATAKKDGISFNGAWAELTSTDSGNTFGKASSGTIEIVLKDVPHQSQFLFEDKTKMAGIYWVKSTTEYGLFGQTESTTCSKYTVEEEGVHTFTFKYANAAWSRPAIVDGEDIPTGSYNTSFSTATFPSGVGTYFGRRSYSSYANSYLKGKILSIRLYSTKLTTEQIKANSVIDKDRFIKKPGLAIMLY